MILSHSVRMTHARWLSLQRMTPAIVHRDLYSIRPAILRSPLRRRRRQASLLHALASLAASLLFAPRERSWPARGAALELDVLPVLLCSTAPFARRLRRCSAEQLLLDSAPPRGLCFSSTWSSRVSPLSLNKCPSSSLIKCSTPFVIKW
jgi:hypothetical protein